MQFTEKENEILDNYFPLEAPLLEASVAVAGLTGDPEEEEWEWEGHEIDDLFYLVDFLKP